MVLHFFEKIKNGLWRKSLCEVCATHLACASHKEALFPWNSTLARIHTDFIVCTYVEVFQTKKSSGVLWNWLSHQSSRNNVAYVCIMFILPSFLRVGWVIGVFNFLWSPYYNNGEQTLPHR